jgi:hypothetical protein
MQQLLWGLLKQLPHQAMGI